MDTAIMIKLPESFGGKEARKLGRDLKSNISIDNPCVIVDLSRVKNIDLAGLEGLLNCMDEVAKRDGAIQVAGVSPEAATLLELTRMDRLFHKFPSLPTETPAFAVTEATTEEATSGGVVQPQPVAA
jgi:anti-sigma B factor antagonist